jgi:hypothetical protein
MAGYLAKAKGVFLFLIWLKPFSFLLTLH